MSTSVYMCLGASGMLAIVVAIYLFIRVAKYARTRYDAWVERREIDLVNHIVAKRGLVRTEVEQPVVAIDNVVFNPVITHKIYHCASKVDLIKDDAGQPALQFVAGDGDGQHTYALLSNGTMYVRVAGEWMSTGDKARSSALLLNMQPQPKLPAGQKPQSNKANKQPKQQSSGDDNQGDEYPVLSVKRTKAWFDEEKRWANKPGNPLPDGYHWRQFKRGMWGICEDE